MMKIEDLRIGQEVWYVKDLNQDEDLRIRVGKGKITSISYQEVKVNGDSYDIKLLSNDLNDAKVLAKNILKENYEERLNELKSNFEYYNNFIDGLKL